MGSQLLLVVTILIHFQVLRGARSEQGANTAGDAPRSETLSPAHPRTCPLRQPCRVRYGLGGLVVLLFILGSNLGREGPDICQLLGLRGGERRGWVRSGPGAARTNLLFHIISARPSKQPRMVGSTLGVYRFGLIFCFCNEERLGICGRFPQPSLAVAASHILLLYIISVRPSKQPLMVRTFLKVYMELCSSFLFLQEQIKDIIIICPPQTFTALPLAALP
jgi:hypothetical protein